MVVKVKDIYLKLKSLSIDIELLAGESGLSHIIEWFHVVEGKDIASFLEGKEIVVTTGIALKENQENLFDIVQASLQYGASAIIVNVGPYIPEIDQKVLDFCQENSFPLFVSPWHVYMANVVKIIAKELNRQHERQAELISCFKNAVCFPSQQESYIPGLVRYDYETDWQYCMSVIKIKNRQTGDNIRHDLLRELRKKLENTLAFLSPRSLTFRLHDDIVIVFANQSEESINMNMKQVIENISRPIKRKYQMYIGVGRNTLSIRCIHKTYMIASKVAKLQQKSNKEYDVLSYKDMGISKLFLAMDDTEIMAEYYNQVLKELVQYDEMNHTDYVGFLEIYFEEGCRIQDVASHLYLHRNSVNYKLRKIEDILNCDLSDFQTKAELMVAIQLRRLL